MMSMTTITPEQSSTATTDDLDEKVAAMMTGVPLRDRAGLQPAQAAVFLGVAVSTLKRWRSHGEGPLFAKVGASVLYRPADLESFLESKIIGGPSKKSRR